MQVRHLVLFLKLSKDQLLLPSPVVFSRNFSPFYLFIDGLADFPTLQENVGFLSFLSNVKMISM